MKSTLSRPLTEEDLKYKGFPFECVNCGNKPLPQQVLDFNGVCEICGDDIIAYVVDTAEFILGKRK